jgi:pyridoxal phosphate enzyme (YggS family)
VTVTPTAATPARAEEIAANLADVRARLARACDAAGRPVRDVRLLAVTKTFPAADAAVLLDLGCTDLAEAREQEATPKVAEVAALRPGASPRWTVLGRLQRNKARSVARWAQEVQSVDSLRLLDALDRAAGSALQAGERSDPLDVLLQVSLDSDPDRGGCPVEDLAALVDRAAGAPNVRLRGLMAVAPLGADPDASFARLAVLGERTRATHPGADELSAGMSGDLERAVAHGSTCVRVGTALLGARPLA